MIGGQERREELKFFNRSSYAANLPPMPSPPPPFSPSGCIVGIDLAWGERNGDGLCLLEAAPGGEARVVETAHVFGDKALFEWLAARVPSAPAPATLLFDAPLLCPNATGSRPVDRLAQTMFRKFHAGPHPANAGRCGRPLRLASAMKARFGFEIGWRAPRPARLAVEVFPHPATVRWFGLERIVKYKRGPLPARRAEFARLQGLVRAFLPGHFPQLAESAALSETLTAPWTKPNEDRLDAVLCALVGYQHWRDDGRSSEVIGDETAGFILLPSV